jgi:hypothetical protein
MNEQNYANHKKLVPMFHGVTFPLLAVTLIGSLVNLWKSLGDHQRLYSASLIASLSIVVLFIFFFSRMFALKAQDRAIRAEENLRHFVLTGRLLDPGLSVHQVIALRFASDEEFVPLAQRALAEKLTADSIKRSIKNWRADLHRV